MQRRNCVIIGWRRILFHCLFCLDCYLSAAIFRNNECVLLLFITVTLLVVNYIIYITKLFLCLALDRKVLKHDFAVDYCEKNPLHVRYLWYFFPQIEHVCEKNFINLLTFYEHKKNFLTLLNYSCGIRYEFIAYSPRCL